MSKTRKSTIEVRGTTITVVSGRDEGLASGQLDVFGIPKPCEVAA